MPRKPASTIDIEEEAASADDFLSSLEDDEDTPIFLEGDEKVTEEDIARELGIDLDADILLGEKPAYVAPLPAENPAPVKRGPGRPRKNPLPVAQPGDAVGAPEDDILSEIIPPAAPSSEDKMAALKAAYETGRLVAQTHAAVEALVVSQKASTAAIAELTVKVNDVHEAILSDVAEILSGFGKSIETLTALVTQVHQMVHAAPKTAPAPKEKSPEPVQEEAKETFVAPVVNDYVEKEVRTIVTSIPKGSRPLPVNQLAEVIARKRFNGDAKAQSEIVHVLRTRLSDLGSVTQDDQFHRL